MEKSVLKFSEDRTSFVISLASGSETMDITSKEEGFKAITKLANDKKITPEEFSEMRDQIFNTEELPWSESKKILIGVVGGDFLKSFLTGTGALYVSDIMARPEKPVEVAYFDICESCGKHGRIYAKKYYSFTLRSKRDAISCLKELKKCEVVTEEEFQKVKTEIEASTLPKK